MTERNMDKDFDSLRADIDSLRKDLAQMSRAMTDLAAEKVAAAADQARASVDKAGEKLGEAGAAARARARQGAADVEQRIEERPFASVAAAFGVGLLIGRVLSR